MGAIFVTAATASGLFAGTNIDDMIVLAVLNASSRADGRPRAWQIWAGQYAGVGALVAVSLLAALGLKVVPESWLWVLGVIPLGLGLYKLLVAVRAHRAGRRASAAVATGLTGVIGVTIANGGDNVAAYTPVFRTLGGSGIAVTIAVFIIGIAFWCLAGFWLVWHRSITEVIERWGQWIVPVVFILIGLYIFQKAGVLGSARRVIQQHPLINPAHSLAGRPRQTWAVLFADQCPGHGRRLGGHAIASRPLTRRPLPRDSASHSGRAESALPEWLED